MTRQGKCGLAVTNAAVSSSDCSLRTVRRLCHELQTCSQPRMYLPRAGCGYQLQQDLCGSFCSLPMTVVQALCVSALCLASKWPHPDNHQQHWHPAAGTLLSEYLIPNPRNVGGFLDQGRGKGHFPLSSRGAAQAHPGQPERRCLGK